MGYVLTTGLSTIAWRMTYAQADPSDTASLHRLLLGAVKRHGSQPQEIDDFELIVRRPGDDAILTTYVALSP